MVLIIVGVILIGCSESVNIITQPDTSGKISRELVGCWELAEADHYLEGNLFITFDGNGVEYIAGGALILTNQYDFHTKEYELTDDLLRFDGRVYRRNNIRYQPSPCDYFPDEGMIKLFLIDGIYHHSIRVGYDRDREKFFERRSVWTEEKGFEQDTVYYLVESPAYYCTRWPDRSSMSWMTRVRGVMWTLYPIHSFEADYYSRTINDTTLKIGTLRSVDEIMYSRYGEMHLNHYYRDSDHWLGKMFFGNSTKGYFTRDIGMIAMEYEEETHTDIEIYHKTELIDYFNPMTTQIARQAFLEWDPPAKSDP